MRPSLRRLNTVLSNLILLSFVPSSFGALQLDPTFGSSGRVTIAPSSSTTSTGLRVFVQPGGRILAAGRFSRQGGDGQMSGVAIFGLTAGGQQDPSYVTTDDWQAHGQTSLSDVESYPDGRIVRLRRFFNVVGSSIGSVVRHGVDGSTDSVFTSNAVIGNPGGFGTVRPAQIAIRNDGKVVMLISDNSQWQVYRLNPDGTRDTSFGTNGIVTIHFNQVSVSPSTTGFRMLVQPDGKVILVGPIGAPGTSGFFVARLTETGNWDKSFGRIGFVRLNGAVQDALLQPDGKVLLAGSVSGPDADTWMMRLRGNGRIDNSFGSGGTVVRDFTPDGTDTASALAISSDGKIRIVGYAGAVQNFLVARFSANGAFEESTTIEFTSGQYARGSDIAIQPDGKLVVIGETRNPDAGINGGVFALARLTE